MSIKDFFLGKPWGQETTIEITNCDPQKIRSKANIKKWLKELPKAIDMKTFGEPQVERFALHDPKVAGYSAFIFLETSNLCAHFAEESNTVLINVFSCKKFNPNTAWETSAIYFGIEDESYGVVKNTIRRIPPKWIKIIWNIWKASKKIVNSVITPMVKFRKSN